MLILPSRRGQKAESTYRWLVTYRGKGKSIKLLMGRYLTATGRHTELPATRLK